MHKKKISIKQNNNQKNAKEGETKSLFDKIKGSVFVKIIAFIGIIVTILIQNNATYYYEKYFPRVYFIGTYRFGEYNPKIHLLSDPVNITVPAIVSGPVMGSVVISLENDNNTPIFINSFNLILDEYKNVPRDQFLLIQKTPLGRGSSYDSIHFITSHGLTPCEKEYPLLIVDKDTKEINDDAYLLIDSGMTDLYSLNLDYEDEGLYTFHFEIDYTIHGKKHSVKTDKTTAMYIDDAQNEFKNPDATNLKDYLVSSISSDDRKYNIYGDGTIVLDYIYGTNSIYGANSFILNRLIIEEGLKSLNHDYLSVAGPGVTKVYLPSTLKYIDNDTFTNDLFQYHYYDTKTNDYITVPTTKTIYYNGTEAEWKDIIVEENNDILYDCDFIYLK